MEKSTHSWVSEAFGAQDVNQDAEFIRQAAGGRKILRLDCTLCLTGLVQTGKFQKSQVMTTNKRLNVD